MSEIFDSIAVSPVIDRFVHHSWCISDVLIEYSRLHSLDSDELAHILEYPVTTVQEMFSGCYDFTLREIAHMEHTLDLTLINPVRIW